MSGSLGELVVSISTDIARFQSDMGKVAKITEDHAKTMATALSSSISVISGIGTALAGIAVGAGFSKMINDAADWNINAMKMANTLGVTSQEASVLSVALHSLGIDNEVATNAALKLSKTLATGTEKFDQFGIKVKDSHGNLLPMTEIMANVNSELLNTEKGADRNIMAMTLYGRTWKDLQPILRLTKESMDEAKETAERLHLIVGQEGIDKSLQYKKSVHEIELVSHSLAVQIGNELMPIIVDLGTSFGEAGVHASSFFATILHEGMKGISESKLLLGKTVDKVMSFPGFFDKNALAEWDAENKAGEAMYRYNLEKLSERMGGLSTAIVKAKSAKQEGNKIDISALGGGADADQKHYDAYLAKLAELNKGIADANPYIDEYDKKMAGVYATVDKLSTEFPEYTRTWNKYGEAIEHNINLAERYKYAIESLTDMTGSDAYQNFIGKMGEQISKGQDGKWSSQQTRFDDNAMIKQRSAELLKSLTIDGEKTQEFYALKDEVAGNSMKMELYRIDMEQKAWIESWAMQTSSFEEYERRKLLIANLMDNKRQALTPQGKIETALTEYAKNATDTGKQVGELFTNTFKGMEDALTKFVTTGQLNFKALADSIISDMVRIMIQQEITGPLAGMMGGSGGLISTIFGGGKAAGGPVDAGMSYLIGEQGPEIFTAGASGAITPNSALSGGGGGDNIYHFQIDARGADVGVEAKIQRGIQQAVNISQKNTLQDFRRAGPISRTAGRG